MPDRFGLVLCTVKVSSKKYVLKKKTGMYLELYEALMLEVCNYSRVIQYCCVHPNFCEIILPLRNSVDYKKKAIDIFGFSVI